MLLEGSANRCYWVSWKVAQIYPHPFQATSWAVEAAAKVEIIICRKQFSAVAADPLLSDSVQSNARKASESDSGSLKLKVNHPTIPSKNPSLSALNAAELTSLSRV